MALPVAGIRRHSARPPETDAMPALWRASGNFGPRRDGLRPTLIVLHYTAMNSPEAALQRLCDPQAEVSAHYLIAADGTLWQMVREDMRAWHAGAGEWAGCDDINSRSVGVELDNDGTHPFAEPQMRALESLLPGIMARWAIPPSGVIGHSCMAPGRKCDPGRRFDWTRLSRQGLAGMPPCGPAQAADRTRFRQLARTAGFTAPAEDAALLDAVRLRFRPWGKGPLCREDMAVLSRC